MLAQRFVAQRVAEVYAVAVGQLTVLQTVLEILLVLLQLTFLVRLLNAATRRRIIVSHGQTDHRLVGQVDRTLHEPLAEGAPADHYSAVLILYGTGYNLCRRRREFVDEHHDAALLQRT